MTSLTMAKVVLKDAGNYKVTLENENGQASFTVKLIVLGRIGFYYHFAYILGISAVICRALLLLKYFSRKFCCRPYKLNFDISISL